MIIQLKDADITTAQDDLDYEGVIKVPDPLWNHVIKETQVPDQKWVDELYLDVSQLSIGGSGLPIVIYSIKLSYWSNAYETINTWDMNSLTLTPNQPYNITIPDYSVLFVVKEFNTNPYYRYSYALMSNSTTNDKTYTITTNEMNTATAIRYYLVSGSNNTSSPFVVLFDSNNNYVLRIDEKTSSDNAANEGIIYKNFIDFLWINN